STSVMPSPSSVLNWPGLLVRITNKVVLGELEVVLDPQLAAQAVAELQPLADDRLLFPVRLGQMLAALEDLAHAGAALAHAASVLEMRKRELLDAGPHDEVAVFLDLALVHLAVLMDGDLGHGLYTKRRLLALFLVD